MKSKDGITQLNNTNLDPHAVARSREELTRQRAVGEAASRGGQADLAPAPELGEDTTLEQAIRSGSLRVVVPERKEPPHQKFGPESRLPGGSMVRKDGTPCPEGEEPFGVIGNVDTSFGILVNRVIPFDALQD